MNIAIIMGQSDYQNVQKLHGCKNDVKTIFNIITATNKYQKILCLDDNCKSAYEAQNKIVSFLEDLGDENIEECFVYFSGHGDFDGTNFYYVWQDYASDNKTNTCLINSDIDNLIRKISPNLFVKLIDACNSGVNYIKSLDSFKKFLEDNKQGFRNCYFMFSSQNTQSSYANENMSSFTEKFLQSLKGDSGKIIRYTNIINYLAEQFESNKKQLPQFIVQGTLSDVFCTLNDKIMKIIDNVLNLRNPLSKTSVLTNISDDLLKAITDDSKKYVSFVEATDVLKEIANYMNSMEVKDELKAIFDAEITEGKEYSLAPNIESVAAWADSAKIQLFLNVQTERVEYKKRVPKNVFSTSSLFASIHGGIPDDECKIITETRYNPVSISTTLKLPYQFLNLHLKSKYPNILDKSFYVLPILNRTKLYLFSSKADYVRTDWEGQILSTSGMKWKCTDFDYVDVNNIKLSLEKMVQEDFFDVIQKELEEKFLPEMPNDNTDFEKK